MTKPLRIFLTLVLLSVASAAKANTLYYIVDNIRYAVNTDNSTATVVRNYGYEDMTEITIPASITVDGTTYTVDQIGDHCFSYCSSLTSITIPNSVTQLGDYLLFLLLKSDKHHHSQLSNSAGRLLLF